MINLHFNDIIFSPEQLAVINLKSVNQLHDDLHSKE